MKVDVFFTYDKGQEVIVKKTGNKGVVRHREFHIYENDNKTTITEKYSVNMGGYASASCNVDELMPVSEFYELNDPDGVDYVLTDVSLKSRDFAMLKNIQNDKKKRAGGN